MSKVYLYQHIRKDNREVFYVGIGNKRRPSSKINRNRYWHNVVNKCGYDIEVVRVCEDFEEAQEWEKFLISMYGRKDSDGGSLVNMTDGGIGYYNPSEEFRAELSKRWSGEGNPWYGKSRESYKNPFYGKKHTDESRKKMGLKGDKHPFYGKKRPEVSEKLSGENNPMWGVKRDEKLKEAVSNAQSKAVINIETGETYKNTIIAAEASGINLSTLRAKLIGRLKNNTPYRYI